MSWRRPNPVFSDEYAVLREVLRQARERSGISQRALALRLKKSHSHVVKIEIGQRRVDTLEFYRIARSLDVDPVELFRCVATRLDALSEDQDEGLGSTGRRRA